MNLNTLNTVFKQKSNKPCNNAAFTFGKLGHMREDMKRLYAAARELRNVEGQSAVARLLGESPQTVRNWETRGISKKGLLVSQRVIGCSANWLETGAGQMQARARTELPINVSSANVGARQIPLISYVQAGLMTETIDLYVAGDAEDWLLTDLDLSESAFALRIKGESMLPEFREGDTVIIDPSVEPLPGDYVVAKNGENEATFKRYRPRGTNDQGVKVFELVPLNEDYESIRSDATQVRIVGTMVEHRRYRKR